MDKISYDKKLPRESEASFQKFLLYRNLPPHDRNLKLVQEIIQNKNSKKKITMNSLNQLAYKWSWVERCKLYDADRQLKLARKRAGKFDEFNGVMLDNVGDLINYANNLLGEVIENPVNENGKRYSLASRIKMANDVSKLLKESNELACNITGRPYEYKELNLNANVSENTINLFDKIKKIREEE